MLVFDKEGKLATQNRHITTLYFVKSEGELPTEMLLTQIQEIRIAPTTASSSTLSEKSDYGTQHAPRIKYSRGNT